MGEAPLRPLNYVPYDSDSRIRALSWATFHRHSPRASLLIPNRYNAACNVHMLLLFLLDPLGVHFPLSSYIIHPLNGKASQAIIPCRFSRTLDIPRFIGSKTSPPKTKPYQLKKDKTGLIGKYNFTSVSLSIRSDNASSSSS